MLSILNKFCVLGFALCLLGGCDSSSRQAQSGQTAAVPETESTQTETQRLNLWFDQRYAEGLAFSPISKAFMGIKDEDYGLVGDFSEVGLDKALAWQINSATQLREQFNYADLTEQGRESYDLWLYLTDQAAAAEKFRGNTYLFNQFSSLHRRLPMLLISWHDVQSHKDLQDYVSRIRESAKVTRQLIDRARMYADGGVHAPYFAFDIVLTESQRLIQGWPFVSEGDEQAARREIRQEIGQEVGQEIGQENRKEDQQGDGDKQVELPANPIWADFDAEVARLLQQQNISEQQAASLRNSAMLALREHWRPAIEDLIAWLREDRKNAMQPATGVGSLPNGADYYRERLAFHTTTTLSADEVHAIGLENVARLHEEIAAVQKEVGFVGSRQAFFSHLREAKDDPRFYFADTDAGRQGYLDESTALLDNIKGQLPAFFGLLPKADLVVKRVEAFREQAGAAQHYNISSADGSRPGIYYAHLSDMTTMPRYQMESVAYHEGLPGHHMQLAIAAELQGVPEFRKRAWVTAYTEGWGLYAEGLAKEIPGTYVDPYSEVGRLGAELWRAIRLVVDTGLHAKGWTEQQAIDYMAENSGNAIGQIRSEIRRYIVGPGQATAYMIGNLKIRELRAMAEVRLQDQFDLRAFHDVVLGSGPLPLGLLQRKVERWINSF